MGRAVTDTKESQSKRNRVWSWLRAVERDPALEEKATNERRERLLSDLNQAVANAPDDMPIREIIRTLNRHDDD